MTTPADYRQFADECIRWAHKAKTEEERQRFVEMASAWSQAASFEEDKPPIFARAAPKSKRTHR
jgi:hypothetical protein